MATKWPVFGMSAVGGDVDTCCNRESAYVLMSADIPAAFGGSDHVLHHVSVPAIPFASSEGLGRSPWTVCRGDGTSRYLGSRSNRPSVDWQSNHALRLSKGDFQQVLVIRDTRTCRREIAQAIAQMCLTIIGRLSMPGGV